VQALACLRAMGVGIEDMRTYQAKPRPRGHEAAGEQRDLLVRHAERIEGEIETNRTHLDYLRVQGRVVGCPRTCGDADAETRPNLQVQEIIPRLEAGAAMEPGIG